MRKISFYTLVFAPMLVLALLSNSSLLDANAFFWLLLLYVVAYHPTIVGLRLLTKHVIAKDDFFKTYIPFWNMKYFSEAFF